MSVVGFFTLRYASPPLARARLGDIVESEAGSGIRWRVTGLFPPEVELTSLQGSPPFRIVPWVYSLCCRAGEEKSLPMGRIPAELLADFRARRDERRRS